MSGPPLLSVIVPAYRAARLLPDTLGALRESTFPRDRWELIVVDDASGDATAAVGRAVADQVVVLEGRPRGPGGARNAGAARAGGEWLMFLDADVRVHPDTLARLAGVIETAPGVAAVFGSYDASPAAPGLVSQFRNLLHRYVHLTGAGEAQTFWAGCGAVRRDWFERLGGFDTARFPRPQIEDIELGYRIRDAGGRILLDPRIQGTHLKRWTVAGLVRTDLRDRGIPWMRLLLERSGWDAASLNVGGAERYKVTLMGAALAAVAGGAMLAWGPLLALGLLLALAVAAWNLPLLRWLARERSPAFALAATPVLLLHYALNVLAALAGLGLHAWHRARAALPERAL